MKLAYFDLKTFIDTKCTQHILEHIRSKDALHFKELRQNVAPAILAFKFTVKEWLEYEYSKE